MMKQLSGYDASIDNFNGVFDKGVQEMKVEFPAVVRENNIGFPQLFEIVGYLFGAIVAPKHFAQIVGIEFAGEGARDAHVLEGIGFEVQDGDLGPMWRCRNSKVYDFFHIIARR